MDELLREFVGETLDMMEAVAADLVAWEAAPADRRNVDGIFRTIHTVKGSSGFFDLPRITAAAHAAEELLEALRSRRAAPDKSSVSAVLRGFDHLRELTRAVAEQGVEPVGDDSALIAALLADVRPAFRKAFPATLSPPPQLPEPQPEPHLETQPDPHPEPLATRDMPIAWRSVRVPVDLIDGLMNGASDLALARNEVAAQLRALGVDATTMPSFDRVSALLGQMRQAISQMRMVPVRQLFAPLPRLIRQLSTQLGKEVRLSIGDGTVEIDREVIEQLRDPLIHILRNAIDHGIERPDQRLAAGKPVFGQLRVSAHQSGNRIILHVEDDGAGLSLDRLAARALSAGVVATDELRAMTDAAKAQLIFHPGLSTAEKVTDISGRGVGMDVVKANVERLGGRITLENREGLGLSIAIDVPMTLTIVSALIIDTPLGSFAVPRNIVEEVMLTVHQDVELCTVAGVAMARVRGEMLARLTIEDVLGYTQPEGKDHEAPQDRVLILARAGGHRRILLDVPDVRDCDDLVIKPLPPILQAIGLYCGLTQPDSGEPMLVLDVEGLARKLAIPDGQDRSAAVQIPATKTAQWLVWQRPESAAAALPLSAIIGITPFALGDITHVTGQYFARFEGAFLPLRDGLGGSMENADITGHLVRLQSGAGQVAMILPELPEIMALPVRAKDADGKQQSPVMLDHDGMAIALLDVADLQPLTGNFAPSHASGAVG
jgi:two-component system chemotaxis sensor kinase CheA